MPSILKLTSDTFTEIEYNYNEGYWELINCICKEDWTDGTAYCQNCGKKRIMKIE